MDAAISSAREILFRCRGQLSTQIRQEKSRGQPDAQRLADLEPVMSQLRDDINAVTAGNRTVITRVRVLAPGEQVCVQPQFLVEAWVLPNRRTSGDAP